MCGAPERVIRQKDDVCVLVRRVRACVVRVDVCVCSCAPSRERIRYEGPEASAAGKAAERGTGRLYVGVVMVRLVASVFSGGWRRSVGGGKGTA